ncbi:MAG: C39 family peptidase, partial [Promethearchaeota archaeon]
MSIKRKMKIQSKFRRKIIFISILIIINLPMGFKFASEQKAVYSGLISTFNTEPLNDLNTANNQVLIQSVPMHYQINNYYCGPAALEMILDYYGPDIPQDEIAEVARTYEGSSGTFCDDMRRAGHFSNISLSRGIELPGSLKGYPLRRIGYASFEANLNNITCLRELIDLGYPILIITWSSDTYDSTHFRVVTGYNHQNGIIQNFILNDPWIGPNYIMDVNMFIDLWSSHSNWSLFVCSWNIRLTYPSTVEINSNFTVTASIQYPCPIYFNPLDYPATDSRIKLVLPNGLSLAPYENETKPLDGGFMHARDNVTVQWNITTGSTNFEGSISIEAFGK